MHDGGGLHCPSDVAGYGQPYRAAGSAFGFFVPDSRICRLPAEGCWYATAPVLCRSTVEELLLLPLPLLPVVSRLLFR